MPALRRSIQSSARELARVVARDGAASFVLAVVGLACCFVFCSMGSSVETVAMRSSELFAPSGQADALPTFAVTAGSLAAYALFGWAPLRAVDRLRGSMPVYAVCCVALAAVYAVTSLPVLSDASGARAFLLVLRGFLGVTTLVSWFALLGDRPRLFQVSAIAVAFAATALADLAFLALQAAVGFALLVVLPLLSLGAYRVVARKRSGAGAADADLFYGRPWVTPSRRAPHRAAWRACWARPSCSAC